MFNKKYFQVLIWTGLYLLPVIGTAQEKWLRALPSNADSGLSSFSKKNLQQLSAVTEDSGRRLIFQGFSSRENQAAVLWFGKKWNKKVYRVDLSTVVSKYIGETEKNINAVFDEAKGLKIILYFDEADALFGKRTNVRDAHDKYANQEVSFLLNRLERFEGLAILASNRRTKFDSSFLRQFKHILKAD